ncbi:hypothetical protein [Vibrio parahaemolyticus]|uniref:hypothetical protein n=1 Tax=Vibrio parahaemolyticus TaxID=670 RepID=UPI003892C506
MTNSTPSRIYHNGKTYLSAEFLDEASCGLLFNPEILSDIVRDFSDLLVEVASIDIGGVDMAAMLTLLNSLINYSAELYNVLDCKDE